MFYFQFSHLTTEKTPFQQNPGMNKDDPPFHKPKEVQFFTEKRFSLILFYFPEEYGGIYFSKKRGLQFKSKYFY